MRLELNVYVCILNYLLQKLKAVPPTAEEWAREGRPLALAPRGCRSSTHLWAARLGGAHEVCEDTRSRRPRCQQRRGGPVASPGAVRPGVKCPRSWRWYFGSRWGSVRFPSRGVKRLSLAQLTGNRRRSGVVSREATALGQRYDTRGLPPSVAPGLTPRRDCDRHRGPG